MCPCLKEAYTCLREHNQFSTDSKGRRVLHDSYLLLLWRERNGGAGGESVRVDGWGDIQCRLSESAVTVCDG